MKGAVWFTVGDGVESEGEKELVEGDSHDSSNDDVITSTTEAKPRVWKRQFWYSLVGAGVYTSFMFPSI